MKKNMICIVCPFGCSLDVEILNDEIKVSGNSCPRGREYAVSECTNPTRIVTSSIRCENGSLLPVKTDRGVPAGKIFDVMKILSEVTISLPIKVGDVIIENVYGCNIVATGNME